MSIRSCFLLFLLASANIGLAQDTIRVQTLTFNDITMRRGWFAFPDTTHQFRKVLMHHTLKCDPQTTQDQYACGEWDYLTYNLIHEHTGVLDSTAQTHPYFKVGAATPDSAEEGMLYWDNYLTWRHRVLSSQLNNVSLHAPGAETQVEFDLFNTTQLPIRGQYLLTAAELQAAGLSPGPIHQLRLPLILGNGHTWRTTLRMKGTAATELDGFDDLDLVTLFDDSISVAVDTLVIPFAAAFAWNGLDNLIVDVAQSPMPFLSTGILQGTDAPAGTAIMEFGNDGYLELKDDYIGVDPTLMADLGTAITITFRTFGAPELPQNTVLLDARDAQGRRLLNIHLPWSDGRVYWDAGSDGSGYDRIDKATIPSNIEGQWNNWAFVKNTTTGTMKIYLNGVLWHSGTGKTKPLAGITGLRIGSDLDGNLPYPGLLNELNIFNAELSAQTIAEWHDRKVMDTHPDFDTWLYGFSFDEPAHEHEVVNRADQEHGAWLLGSIQHHYLPNTALHNSPMPRSFRPLFVFVQGDITTIVDSVLLVGHQVPSRHIALEYFAVQGNSIVPVDTLFGHVPGFSHSYGPDGEVLDSTEIAGTLHLNDTLNYFATPFEVVNNWEIGRYITPYGIGLSLGPQGFRWTFDVTDYQWMLHDSVELSAGNQQELIDLEFEMIEGTPPREVVAQQRPWGGLTSRSYADLSGNVAFPPVQVDLSPDATQWSLRARLTGHGHNSNTGNYPHCCEWKDNTHYLHLNGAQIDAWHIWQENDCALNPVYPQGGTWLGSREGWCPGDLVKDHEVELPGLLPGGTATFDYSITPVPANNLGMGGGNYVMNMDLMEFGAPAHQLDAEIYEVKRPSTTDMWRRENPICHAPLIVLRNAGAQTLTSATITYSVSGGMPQTYTWTGSLAHMQRAEVELPVLNESFWAGDDDRVFTAVVSQPNGGSDQYADNNSYRAAFEMPIAYPHFVILHYKTNNRPNETSMRVLDIAGNVLLSRSAHTANTQYIDTLDIGNGCYTLEVLDTGNDGLEYWADPDAGSGYVRLKRPNGVPVVYFEQEFGRAIHYPFSIAIGVGLDEVNTELGLAVFPNPSNGHSVLHASGLIGDASIEVVDAHGRLISAMNAALRGDDRVPIDMSAVPAGMYLVRVRLEHAVHVVRAMKE